MDFFAVPVSLTYKGKRKFGTAVGGCLSLLLILFFIAYSVYILYNMIAEPQFNDNTEKIYFDYADSDKKYHIATQNSTLAVVISAPFLEIEEAPNRLMRVVFM